MPDTTKTKVSEQEVFGEIAEILVKLKHNDATGFRGKDGQCFLVLGVMWAEKINPFLDTLESIHQAHALEDWLYSNHYLKLWKKSKLDTFDYNAKSLHQWRLDRIRYCIEQIIMEER